jgi:hypothetical protein
VSGSLDPVLGHALRASLALLFAAAAWHKLRAPHRFRATLEDHALLPARALAPAAWGLAALEALLAGALLAPGSASAAALVAAGLLCVYGAAITINLARGRRFVACGCLGPAAEQPLSAGLVARNAVLAGTALLAALPGTARELGWLDALTVAGAVAVLCLCYLASDGLLASWRALAAPEARP